MKLKQSIALIVLLVITLGLMFVPIATFKDGTIDSMNAEIEKQQGRLESEQAKYDRYVNQGKKQSDLDKQLAKVEKQQTKVNDLIAERDAAMANASASGLTFALLPGKIPADIRLDMKIINAQNGVYPVEEKLAEDGAVLVPEFRSLYICIWIAAAMLAVTIALVILGRGKLVSKCYTFASFTNLIAIMLLFYSVMRVSAIPVKLPYSNPTMNWGLICLMMALPIAALFINIKAVTNTKRTMIYVLCIFFSILSILPFWIMIVNGTRSSQAIQSGVSLIPSTFLSHNWGVLQSKSFNVMTGFKNSAIIAFGSTLLNVYFSALTAYGLTVYRFRGSKMLYALVLAIIMIPGQVTGTGFFMFMYQLGWTNSYLPLVVPAIASASTVFFFKQYLEANFQVSLVEAARIDGAGEFFTFNRIIIPIMIPAMATMGIMAVIGSWNNYLTPLMLLSTDDMKTLPMMVKELRGDIYRTEYGSIYLGLTLTALPLMIVYFCFSKFIIAGVAVGGVKE